MSPLRIKLLFTSAVVTAALVAGPLPALAQQPTAPASAVASAAVAPAISSLSTAPQKLTAAKPKIKGIVKPGETLRAVPGTWTKGATLSYQWYGNGKKLVGETGKTLEVWRYAGLLISVKVTGTKPGFRTKTVTSKKTRAVAYTVYYPWTGESARFKTVKSALENANYGLGGAYQSGFLGDEPCPSCVIDNLSSFSQNLGEVYNVGKLSTMSKKASKKLQKNVVKATTLAHFTVTSQVGAEDFTRAKKSVEKLSKMLKKIVKQANKAIPVKATFQELPTSYFGF